MDETFWQSGRINKAMAPGVLRDEPVWIWAPVEVNNNGKCGRFVFRVCKHSSEAINHKPRGAGEIAQLVRETTAPGPAPGQMVASLIQLQGTPI